MTYGVILALVFGYLRERFPDPAYPCRRPRRVRKIARAISAPPTCCARQQGLAPRRCSTLKGTAAVLIQATRRKRRSGPTSALFSVSARWLGFKGGKGVATYLGVLIGLAWQVALIFAVVWLAMAFLFRFSSLAALTAAVVVPIALYFMSTPQIAVLFVVMSVIVFIKHRANISRLLAGTEGKIGAKG